ncbi:type II toxin-antitoxin system Phd/YefM family antitoxin [Candidatus Solincola sp.]|nr:type II toxin-antitoxin system Phd/YefM family antitoxin [Actinomycetota bacterium]MDI7251054.1 type II toxin-antitoxin system Phd/YefM family antitoxin [Actinomycetota bacterium]
MGKREFREKLTGILSEARRKGSIVFLTDRGKPEAVFLPVEEYEALMELLEDLRDPDLVAMVKRSRREIAQGKTMGLEELRSLLGL